VSIQLKRGTGAPPSLDDGELALDLSGLALYGGSSGVEKLLGAPVATGTTSDAGLWWDGSAWVEQTGLRVTSSLTEAYQNLRIRDGVFFRFGNGDDVDIQFNGTTFLTDLKSTTWEISNTTGDVLNLRSDNNIEIGGTTIYTDALNTATEFNKGFHRFEVLDEAAYAALSGSEDANTVYIVTP
jgi:hypothetical protein